MTSKNNTPNTSPNPGSNRITAKPVKVTHTKGPDWARSLPVPDNAWRIYETVRSYIYEQDPDSVSVRITDAELAELTHRSVSAAKRARQAAHRWGLLIETRRWTESHGRGTARTVRELSVLLDEVPDWYVGPTNCWDIRRALTVNGGPGIDESQVTTRTDQEEPESENETPGQIEGSDLVGIWSNLLGTWSNLVTVRADLIDHVRLEQHKGDPQESLQEASQEHQQHGAADAADGDVGEAMPKGNDNDEGTDSATRGRVLLEGLRMPHGQEFVPHHEAIDSVAAALSAGCAPGDIQRELMQGTAEARKPAAIVTNNAKRLDALIERHQDRQRRKQRGEEPASTPPRRSGAPDQPCGECEALPSDPMSARVVWISKDADRSRWCRACSPKGIAQAQAGVESVQHQSHEAANALGIR